MMTKHIYVAPRAEKQRKKPVRVDPKPGAAALLANVIGMAVSDFFCGNRRDSEDARWYFAESYRAHVTALGMPADAVPAAIRDRVVFVEV